MFETSFGCWAYRRVGGRDITLGGPWCAPGDRAAMLRRFRAQSRRPIFFYLDRCFVREADAFDGLHLAAIGVDRHVDLPVFLADPAPSVRGALKKASRAGVTLEEMDMSTLSRPLRHHMKAMTRSYLARAEVTLEMRFLNVPMTYRADGMKRVFLLSKYDREHQGAFGYVVLNPVFADGQVTGYLLDLLRFEPTRLWGVWLSTVHKLAELLHGEGHGMALGWCPLHGVEPLRPKGSRVLEWQVDWMVRYLGSARYIRRLRELKSLVPGAVEPRYVASYTPLGPVVLATLMEALGIGVSYLFGPDLIKVLKEGMRREHESAH